MGHTHMGCTGQTFVCKICDFVEKFAGTIRIVARLFNEQQIRFFQVQISVDIRIGVGVDFQVSQLASVLHTGKVGITGPQPRRI